MKRFILFVMFLALACCSIGIYGMTMVNTARFRLDSFVESCNVAIATRDFTKVAQAIDQIHWVSKDMMVSTTLGGISLLVSWVFITASFVLLAIFWKKA